MKLHTFKIGGVHPAENKIAAGKPIVNMPLPAEVVLPVAQHIGAPAKPIVAKGDHVKRGDRVAEAGGFVSAHVHTPISGTVVKIDTARTPQGMPVEAIYIKSDEADREADAATMADTMPKRSDAEIAALDSKAIIELIKDAGIVGLGGATFPAHVKLMPLPAPRPKWSLSTLPSVSPACHVTTCSCARTPEKSSRACSCWCVQPVSTAQS